MSDPIVIVSVARTPMGGMLGSLSGLAAHELGAIAIKAAVERAGIKPEQVNEVIMGNVLQAGQGQAPARQAALGAGLPLGVSCTTIHKVCGSGLKAAMFGHDMLAAGTTDVVVAGGQESMSNAPYLLLKGRQGYRYGHNTVYDHMALDGLEDAYARGTAMGVFAEDCAEKYAFSREDQDAYALESLRRARAAIEDGSFKWEITPVTVAGRKGDTVIDTDEAPLKAMPEKIPTLKPAFKKDGTVTAANASSISDGAAAMVMMRASTAEKLGLKPLARIVAHAQHSQEPAWFTTAPVGALKNLFAKTGWKASDVDLYEINEAFAVVTMAAMKDFDLPRDKVNVHGGATALGHPIGASGARLVTTLIGALRQQGGKKGVATLCIGGGEAVAMAIEML
ncbi:acetyl-CoA acetyltransferase [Bordetella trematum]|uniref:Acetyl-CoA acetyltransferase n=1 Tax=Bordetella trematum TaxID=123899 RepID=A0A157MQJ5_9BORD|nr:acetyl-CoA C-acetyltransferase [Bordetella trematum]AUL48904.1 acetyl-CoA acetyltransferase [Bordetella trematum]AZR95846.1 acetyl-CoA acetyltransferase [Bordetella trematum]NNH21079.1 acetyl-CoA C-acetyltransferase [Bordetella trematum]CZZ87910.1 acetyl-CoA acetyltransferase [Bordetella trematum]SAI11026.1 acetyl-CoA acetyltransferase [Bordetella trematum]